MKVWQRHSSKDGLLTTPTLKSSKSCNSSSKVFISQFSSTRSLPASHLQRSSLKNSLKSFTSRSTERFGQPCVTTFGKKFKTSWKKTESPDSLIKHSISYTTKFTTLSRRSELTFTSSWWPALKLTKVKLAKWCKKLMPHLLQFHKLTRKEKPSEPDGLTRSTRLLKNTESTSTTSLREDSTQVLRKIQETPWSQMKNRISRDCQAMSKGSPLAWVTTETCSPSTKRLMSSLISSSRRPEPKRLLKPKTLRSSLLLPTDNRPVLKKLLSLMIPQLRKRPKLLPLSKRKSQLRRNLRLLSLLRLKLSHQLSL